VEGLLALAEALNGPARAALSSLRGGGNRSGAEAVLTWQTGYPMAVSFQSGAPEYAPASRGAAPAPAAVLVVGAASGLGGSLADAGRAPLVVVGPRASEAPFPTRVAVDTGVAGIHEGGTAYRMDDVPLPLRPPLTAERTAVDVLSGLLSALGAKVGSPR
jgi:formylmethanofuran dehydrogenase subunit B